MDTIRPSVLFQPERLVALRSTGYVPLTQHDSHPPKPLMPIPSRASDKALFTPGPLTTSLAVKQAMLHDAGSWHFEFNAKVAAIRKTLLHLGGVSQAAGYECILLQGSGSFGVESVFATAVPPNGKVLVLVNGAYGERMVQMLQHAKINHSVLRFPENEAPDATAVAKALDEDPSIGFVAVIHCETTTGILNPLEELSKVVKQRERAFFVDAMSSFGAVPIDLESLGIDFMVSSANKAIEGVPGFSYILARREALLANEGHARSLCLDLVAQLRCFEKNGQFRYSPPTHSLLAFEQALKELEEEGGIEARGQRYAENHQTLITGMRELGFKSYLPEALQSFIITSFHYPTSPAFDFQTFYRRLSDKGKIIYPGKISQGDLFRIGSIGRLFPADMEALIDAIARVTQELKITL
ncbi:MAG: 2-aminoethylphosphonate--pyruvate transaminase [Verrucomicrobia subdivision 3 bacterium]|nr:2-aminoethylphosphonate--pyruvate transaminase [Limisphaerales bacterium]MCS1416796.1 2-aminoethylphosphonate--pyruvate transaminase [Limisphaerales bacterium]